jgi:hypothetical protein
MVPNVWEDLMPLFSSEAVQEYPSKGQGVLSQGYGIIFQKIQICSDSTLITSNLTTHKHFNVQPMHTTLKT